MNVTAEKNLKFFFFTSLGLCFKTEIKSIASITIQKFHICVCICVKWTFNQIHFREIKAFFPFSSSESIHSNDFQKVLFVKDSQINILTLTSHPASWSIFSIIPTISPAVCFSLFQSLDFGIEVFKTTYSHFMELGEPLWLNKPFAGVCLLQYKHTNLCLI